MNLNARLRRLERAAGRVCCPKCGHGFYPSGEQEQPGMEMTEEERAQAIFDLLHRHAPDVVYPTLQKCSPDQLEAVLAQVREMLDEARRTRGPDAWGVSP